MGALVAVFIASVLGSLHCVGMCGPLMAFAITSDRKPGATGQSWSERALLQVLYQGSRLPMYMLVGAIAGGAGALVESAGTRIGCYRIASLLAGGLMVSFGVASMARLRGYRLPYLPMSSRIQSLVMAGQRAAFSLGPRARAIAIGLLTAFLPCGWLYLFAVVAAGSGSVLMGMGIMAAFWAGSVPALVLLGVGLQSLVRFLGPRLPWITSLSIVAIGLFTLATRMEMPVMAAQVHPAKCNECLIEQVHGVQGKTPDCCRK